MGANEFIQELIRKQTIRKFYSPIPDDHVLDKGFSSQVFKPNDSYFQIRLSEMFLKDRREYWREFVPLCIIISSFKYENDSLDFPFFVGNQILKVIKEYIEGEYIEYLNTKIVGPVPYAGDDVALFAGLFRTQKTNIAEKFFDFLEKISSAFDPSKISEYINIAQPLSNGLSSLLGMKEIELRLGTRDVFNERPEDPHCFREGYLAYINCSEDEISRNNLWVKDGRLYVGKDKDQVRAFRRNDYCLIKIEHLPRRDDYSTFSFFKKWNKAVNMINQGEVDKADNLFLEFPQHLTNSLDITIKHKNELMMILTGLYNDKKNEMLYGSGKQHSAATRGRGKAISPRLRILKTADKAEDAGFSKNVVKGLRDIGKNWDKIPYLENRPSDFQLTDEILNKQMKALESVSEIEEPDPKAMADAITLATLRGD